MLKNNTTPPPLTRKQLNKLAKKHSYTMMLLGAAMSLKIAVGVVNFALGNSFMGGIYIGIAIALLAIGVYVTKNYAYLCGSSGEIIEGQHILNNALKEELKGKK